MRDKAVAAELLVAQQASVARLVSAAEARAAELRQAPRAAAARQSQLDSVQPAAAAESKVSDTKDCLVSTNFGIARQWA